MRQKGKCFWCEETTDDAMIVHKDLYFCGNKCVNAFERVEEKALEADEWISRKLTK